MYLLHSFLKLVLVLTKERVEDSPLPTFHELLHSGL